MTAQEHVTLLNYPSIRDRLILLNGWSKTYAMTGWRLGYAIWPGKLYDYARKLAVNLHSCVNAPTQYAGIAALTGPQDAVAHMRGEFDKRRKLVVEGLNKLPGVSCIMPKGAFYAFPNVKQTGWKAKPLANALLDETGVALIGGPDFGILGEGYLRLSYANSAENILRALERMGELPQDPQGGLSLTLQSGHLRLRRRPGRQRSDCAEGRAGNAGRAGAALSSASDYVIRFMGLSTDAFHAAIDEEAQKRLGRPIAEAIRQSERLRAVMVAELTEVPGAGAAVAGLTLPKAIASSGSRGRAGAQAQAHRAVGPFRAACLFRRSCRQCQAGAGSVPACRRGAGCRAGRLPGAGRQREWRDRRQGGRHDGVGLSGRRPCP